jgi:hypothetical protein
MAVFITCTTDAFAEVFATESSIGAVLDSNNPGLFAKIRRPLRGIEVKPDTYAVIRVKTASGQSIPLFNSSAKPAQGETVAMSDDYANFIMQSVTENRVEKQQIVETFGEDYIYFFGEKPRFLSITGALLNTADFNWKSEFWTNYDLFLRGTKLVEHNARMYLYFDDLVIEGYLLSANTTHETGSPHLMPVSLEMFITNYAIISNVGSVLFQDFAAAGDGRTGLVAPSPDAMAANADAAARIGASGGIGGFLTATSQFVTDATFSIQSTLEQIQNTFYATQLIVPDGLGSGFVESRLEDRSIANRAQFTPAGTNQEIYKMTDEYIGSKDGPESFDQRELARVDAIISANSPAAVELKARALLESLGVDMSRPSTAALILGRGAFMAAQYVAPMGIRAAGGSISEIEAAGSPGISLL